MEENPEMTEKEQEESLENLYAFVAGEMKAGSDKSTISNLLVGMGIDEADAPGLVDEVHNDIEEAARAAQVTAGSIVAALLGGIVAAVVGGVIWGVIVMVTEYEIGFMAWGMGGLAGFAVLMFTRGKRGVPIQLIAVLSSLVGIAVGKYIAFYHFFKQAVEEDFGPAVASEVSLFSGDVFEFFSDNLSVMFGFLDILFIALAVYTAWRIPQGLGIKLTKGESTDGPMVR